MWRTNSKIHPTPVDTKAKNNVIEYIQIKISESNSFIIVKIGRVSPSIKGSQASIIKQDKVIIIPLIIIPSTANLFTDLSVDKGCPAPSIIAITRDWNPAYFNELYKIVDIGAVVCFVEIIVERSLDPFEIPTKVIIVKNTSNNTVIIAEDFLTKSAPKIVNMKNIPPVIRTPIMYFSSNKFSKSDAPPAIDAPTATIVKSKYAISNKYPPKPPKGPYRFAIQLW